MILRPLTGGGVLAVAQHDHAALAGRLAGAWDDELTPAFRTAVGRHDDVWRERDAAPSWNRATGLPQSFLELSDRERRAVWERAGELAAPLGAETELWILRHAQRLHETYDEAELKAMVARFAERSAALAEGLRAEHGLRFDDTALARGTSLLALLDVVSLRLCTGFSEPVRAGVLTLSPREDGGVAVAPWPFAGDRFEAHLLGRTLAAPFASQAALDAAWAAAPVEEHPVLLVRG